MGMVLPPQFRCYPEQLTKAWLGLPRVGTHALKGLDIAFRRGRIRGGSPASAENPAQPL